MLELPRKLLHNSFPSRVCTSALLGDFSFTRVIVLIAARTTGRKEVFLTVAQDFRKLAEGLSCVLFLPMRITKLVKRFFYLQICRSLRSMAHAQTPVKILKITGLGRSGSTILDVVLGNHPQIESVGEVGNLVRNGWISRELLRGIDQKRLQRLAQRAPSLDKHEGSV